MDIHRIGRTPLGACYRSRLGVLTRRKNLVWRMIVCIDPGYGVVTYTGFDEAEIRAKYEAIREELAKDREVTLEFNDRWLQEMAEPLENERVNIRNLVFIVGGANPTAFDYFKNYRYYSGEQDMFGGYTDITITGVRTWTEFNETLLPPIGSTGSYADFIDFLNSEHVVVLPPDVQGIPGTVGSCGSHGDGHFYETDYDPALYVVLNSVFAVDLVDFDTAYDLGVANKTVLSQRTFFFLDPGDIPTEKIVAERDYLHDYLENPGGTASYSIYWYLSFSMIFPAGSGEFYGFYPVRWSIGPADILVPRAVSTTGTIAPYQHYFCFDLTPEAGVVSHYLTTVYDDNVPQTPSIYRTEGVDQTHDSTETTESLLEEIVATYGSGYRWSYEGRVDSLTLTAGELEAMLPASAFS